MAAKHLPKSTMALIIEMGTSKEHTFMDEGQGVTFRSFTSLALTVASATGFDSLGLSEHKFYITQ